MWPDPTPRSRPWRLVRLTTRICASTCWLTRTGPRCSTSTSAPPSRALWMTWTRCGGLLGHGRGEGHGGGRRGREGKRLEAGQRRAVRRRQGSEEGGEEWGGEEERKGGRGAWSEAEWLRLVSVVADCRRVDCAVHSPLSAPRCCTSSRTAASRSTTALALCINNSASPCCELS